MYLIIQPDTVKAVGFQYTIGYAHFPVQSAVVLSFFAHFLWFRVHKMFVKKYTMCGNEVNWSLEKAHFSCSYLDC